MPRNKAQRARPSTPSAKAFQSNDPASPPETPTTSPPLTRKISRKPRHQPPFEGYVERNALAADPAIRPTGTGHQFSYQPALGPEQLSPQSSSSLDDKDEALSDAQDQDSEAEMADIARRRNQPPSSSSDDGSDADDDESDDTGEVLSVLQESAPSRKMTPSLDTEASMATAALLMTEWLIEELNPADVDYYRQDILQPAEIESSRSSSRSRRREMRGMRRDFENLRWSNEPSEFDQGRGGPTIEVESAPAPDVDIDPEIDAFYRRQQELKRFRRVSMSSSVGKRTYSELSDSDGEDGSTLDINDLGATARRMRKRLHRGSLLFHDPPAPRIDECEEPESSEDEIVDEQALRELPYWTMDTVEVFEMDSS